jgi:hypothetical protein
LIAAGAAAQTAGTDAHGPERSAFLETLDAYRDMGLPYRQVLGIVAFVATFGADDPASAELMVEAEGIIGRLGAKPMQRQLDRLRARRSTGAGRSTPAAAVMADPTAVLDRPATPA